jgi:hypothetical protein
VVSALSAPAGCKAKFLFDEQETSPVTVRIIPHGPARNPCIVGVLTRIP